MAYQKGLRVKNWKFFVGTENFEANNSVPFDKFYYAENVRFKGKYLSSKQGWQKLGDNKVGGTKWRGLFEYQYFDGTDLNRKLIGIYNKQFYEYDPSTLLWDAIPTTWPNLEDKPIGGVVYGNSLYVIGQTNKKGNGVGKLISGYDFTFNAVGVITAPAINSVYQQGGSQYIVTGSNIVAGSGTITTKKLLQTADPSTALVTAAATATCVAGTGSGNGLVNANLTLTSGGSGYTVAPTVVVSGGGGTGAKVIATITAGVVTALTVATPGSGYVTAPTIAFYTTSQLSYVGGGGANQNSIVISSTSPGVIPTMGAIYKQGTNLYKCTGASVTQGVYNYSGTPWTATFEKQQGAVDPTATGSLTYDSGGTYSQWGKGMASITYTSFTYPALAPDPTLNYISFTKSAAPTTSFNVIANSPEGTGITAYAERLITIGDPSFVGMPVHSQPATSAADYYKVENFNVALGGAYFTAAKNSPLTAVNVVNDTLYYSGVDTLYQHTKDMIYAGQNPVELSRTGGALNQNSFTVVENDIWFINKENQIRSLGNERNLGENPRTKALSEVILRYMDALEDIQPEPSISYLNRIVKIRLRTKGANSNNFTIIFDYNTGGFSTDRGQCVVIETVWDNQLIYAEDNSGQCYFDDVGLSGNNTGIPIAAYTPFDDDSRPDTFKRTRYLYFRGQQSYTQPLTLKVFYDGDYTKFYTFTVKSPQQRGVLPKVAVNDGEFGGSQVGNGVFGGDAGFGNTDYPVMYQTEELISLSIRSNLIAVGIEASCNGGKIICEQLIVKVIDEPESYLRATT